jgi:hypothetical protein
VVIPLIGNSLVAWYISYIDRQVELVAEDWLADTRGATVEDVSFQSSTVTIAVRSPQPLPPVSDLLADLENKLPSGIKVVVTTSVGEQIAVGTI